MNNHIDTRARAELIAQKYFTDCQELPTSVLIGRLETLAYRLARDGDNHEATGLFILVADLGKTVAFNQKTSLSKSGPGGP